MHRVTRSSGVGGRTQDRDTPSTQMASNQEQGARVYPSASLSHSGVGINRAWPRMAHQSLRPELNKNWRSNMAPKSASNNDDDDDDSDSEDGGVSIIPAGMRPGWVWGPRSAGSGILVRTEQDKKSSSNEGTSLGSQEGSVETQRRFVPSNAVLGQPPILTIDNAQKAVILGMKLNPNYRGALTDFHIGNAGTTAQQNCSVRVHGIDAEASVKDILDTVRTGKVYSINICRPEIGVIETAAADIVFVTRSAAESYIVEARQGVYIRDKLIQVGWNRNRVKEAKNLALEESRVIRIQGPEHRLSIEILEEFFREYFRFQLVTSKAWRSGPGYKTFELEFESIRPQAAWARRVFKQHFDMAIFHIWSAPDPCEAGNNQDQDRLTIPWRGINISGNIENFPPLQICQAEW